MSTLFKIPNSNPNSKMPSLPRKLLVEILSRLPLESLFRFRSACNSWRLIIDDPVFIKLNTHCPSNDTDHLLIRCRNAGLYSVSLSSLDYSETPTKQIAIANVINSDDIVRRGYPRMCDLPVASCHGLIFIPSSKATKPALLWNPFTGESLELPICEHFASTKMMSCGLAYDSASNDYKAVRIAQCARMLDTFVYSLNSNAWRRVVYPLKSKIWEKVDGCHSFIGSEPGCFAFGALHWIARKDRYRWRPDQGAVRWILAFDVQTETYRNLPLPSAIKDKVAEQGRIDLGACGESLCLTCSYNRNTDCMFFAWMIDDYTSVDNLWIQKWGLRFTYSNPSSCFKLIAHLKKKEQVLFQEGVPEAVCSPNHKPGGYIEKFLLYDIKKKRVKTVIIRGDLECFTSQVFPPSLVRLRKSECADDKSVAPARTLKRKRKTTNDRLQLNLETVHLQLGFQKSW